MFGMRRGLKYIKVAGTIQSMEDNFEHIIMRDNAGHELKFEAMILPKRLQDELEIGNPSVFYLLRFKGNGKMIGALYALENNGRKIYFVEDAISICKSLALQLSIRYKFLSGNNNVRFGYNAICLGIGFGIFELIANFGGQLRSANFISATLAILLTGVFGLYAWYPLVRRGQYAGIPELEKIMDSEGFKTPVFSNSKY